MLSDVSLQANRKLAREMRDRILSLITKLDLGVDEKHLVETQLDGHSPSTIKEVSRINLISFRELVSPKNNCYLVKSGCFKKISF